jgi:hypothetical protein
MLLSLPVAVGPARHSPARIRRERILEAVVAFDPAVPVFQVQTADLASLGQIYVSVVFFEAFWPPLRVSF